jgi:hypothetical protein
VGDLQLGLVRVGDERPPGRQHPPGDALAAAEHDPGPARVHVVPGGGDAAARAVGEVDAGHRAAHGVVGLAAERLEHLDELERGVERGRGAGEGGVALRLRGAAALGFQQGERGGGLVGDRPGEVHRVGVEVARLVADQDRDVAHLAVPGDRHVGHRGDVEALDEVLADALGARGVGDDQRLAGGDHPRHAGGALVQHLHVAGGRALGRGDGGMADVAALGDLREVDLAEAEAVAQRVHERAGDVGGRAGAQHGLREAVRGCQGRSDG